MLEMFSRKTLTFRIQRALWVQLLYYILQYCNDSLDTFIALAIVELACLYY